MPGAGTRLTSRSASRSSAVGSQSPAEDLEALREVNRVPAPGMTHASYSLR